MLGGLIAGALKGASEGYSTYAKGEMENQQKLDYASKILEMQTEKDLRVDEIKRGRDITDIGRKATATAAAAPVLAQGEADAAPIRAKGEVAASVAKIDAADDAGLPGKEAAYKGKQLEANRGNTVLEAEIKGGAEGAGQVAKTNTKGYIGSVAAEAGAKEGSNAKAQGDLARFQLTQLRAVADLRTTLSKETDPARREEIQQQIQDLQLGTSTKSYSDMVTAGDAYRKMADNLRRGADNVNNSDEDRKAMLDRAADYEAQADFILRGTVGKRLPGGAKPPSAAGGKVSGSPYSEGQRLMKDGQTYVVKNGVPVLETKK